MVQVNEFSKRVFLYNRVILWTMTHQISLLKYFLLEIFLFFIFTNERTVMYSISNEHKKVIKWASINYVDKKGVN